MYADDDGQRGALHPYHVTSATPTPLCSNVSMDTMSFEQKKIPSIFEISPHISSDHSFLGICVPPKDQ